MSGSDILQAGPSYESYAQPSNAPSASTSQRSRWRQLRPWSYSQQSPRTDVGSSGPSAVQSEPYDCDSQDAIAAYNELRVSDGPSASTSNPTSTAQGQPSNTRPRRPPPPPPRPRINTRQPAISDEDDIPDRYSYAESTVSSVTLPENPWRTPMHRRTSWSSPTSPTGTASRAIRQATTEPLRVPPSPTMAPQPRQHLDAGESYQMLLNYQSSSSPHGSSSSHTPTAAPSISAEAIQSGVVDPEWHDLVDPGLRTILDRREVKRQGLWWELIKGEVEYVRDLRVICRAFIEPLKLYDPPLLTDNIRLHAFIQEVFSTIPDILKLHEEMLERLLARQRDDWPLVTSATDVLLRTFLEAVASYETYMKNFPFAETRIRRECRQNSRFAMFLQDRRNDADLTRRRDLSVFLSRPVTRLPRILLLLDAIVGVTPEDHPDQEELPTVQAVLQNALKASQPGIETAEAKIKLWDFGETLMFRKGEIIELDFPEPKRTLVHAGYVFRRVRSETNWHGWQDLHAFLLDNYFLLTRDEEQGKHIVVSRPIHIDFLELVSADGVPERRHDYINQVRRRASRVGASQYGQDRLMYPLTIALRAGSNTRLYTLCVSSQAARDQWREKIESAKALRRFDVESNRTYAVHTINSPGEIQLPAVVTADTFHWTNREAVVVAAARSIWIGWRRDSHTYRELVRFPGPGVVSVVAAIPDFGWLLVVFGGALVAFSLREMMPTHAPATWHRMTRVQGVELSAQDQECSLVRIGVTKGRLLVVHCTYLRTNSTLLTFEEPLHAAMIDHTDPRSAFRRFAQLTVPGFATDISFFRQTIAIVTDRTIMVAEPGNASYNTIPTLPADLTGSPIAARLSGTVKPMAMYQTGENEFLLAYDWGACFTTRYGEISRNGSYIRWNVIPSHIAPRPPHLLLFDEEGGRAEVRLVANGKMCEVVEWKGMRPLRLVRADQPLLAISPGGLLEIVETVAV